MKGICALAAAIILAAGICLPATYSYAESASRYARAETRYAYFYSSKSQSSALFTIPYTYCVEIISEDGDWYYVKYAEDYGAYRALYGYCLKDSLTEVDGTPEVIYLYKEIYVTYTADAGGGSLPVLNELTVNAAFYGTYYSGPSAYSYVLCQGSYGYVEGANDDYELIDYKTEDQTTDEDGGGEETENVGGKIIAGVALGVIALACVLMMLFAGRRKRFT